MKRCYGMLGLVILCLLLSLFIYGESKWIGPLLMSEALLISIFSLHGLSKKYTLMKTIAEFFS